MVKPKQRQLPATPAKKKDGRSGLIDSLSFRNEVDLNGNDGWVIVKKQKVTILIPPLPATKKTTTPNSRPSQQEAKPRKTANNQSHIPSEAHPRMPSVEERDKSTALAPKKAIQFARKTPAQNVATLSKPPVPHIRLGIESPGQVHASKSRRILGISNTPVTFKRQSVLHGTTFFLDKSTLLDQRLRAANLEKKLQRAGGLSRWLASLGLGQFVRIFQGKSVNKFQLVNLTMKKLKDMGAHAVGPRRKLMHAIDCICQPYSFKAS